MNPNDHAACLAAITEMADKPFNAPDDQSILAWVLYLVKFHQTVVDTIRDDVHYDLNTVVEEDPLAALDDLIDRANADNSRVECLEEAVTDVIQTLESL